MFFENNETVSLMSKESGVAAIEFSLGFLAFFMMIALFFEITYMSYISSITDLMIAQAVRDSKLHNQGSDFKTIFENRLKSDQEIWSSLVNKNNFRFSIRYVKDFSMLKNVKAICEPKNEDGEVVDGVCGEALGSPIAIYRISYDYIPVFNFYSKGFFSREMIVVQEYQRDAFSYGG